MKVRFAHGAAITREGIVLPPLSADHRWAARTLAYDPLTPPDSPDDLDE